VAQQTFSVSAGGDEALSSQLVQLAPASDLWKLIVIVVVSVLIGVLFLILPIWSAYFAARKETNTGEDS
jgi:hypothetical protein